MFSSINLPPLNREALQATFTGKNTMKIFKYFLFLVLFAGSLTVLNLWRSGMHNPPTGNDTPPTAATPVSGATPVSIAWTHAPYGMPTIVETPEKGFHVTAPDAGGIVLTAPLEAGKSYRLTVKGEKISGADPTVRLRIDANDPLYLPAPNQGTLEHVIHGGTTLEVMLYQDQPFAYLLPPPVLTLCDQACSEPEASAEAQNTHGSGLPDIATVARGQFLPTMQLYKSPSVKLVNKAILLSSSEGGGIELRYDGLDPKKIYRVTIDASPTSGSASLGLRTTEGPERQYDALTEGPQEFFIQRSDWAEFLLYSDTSYAATLRDITISECQTCTPLPARRLDVLEAEKMFRAIAPGKTGEITVKGVWYSEERGTSVMLANGGYDASAKLMLEPVGPGPHQLTVKGHTISGEVTLLSVDASNHITPLSFGDAIVVEGPQTLWITGTEPFTVEISHVDFSPCKSCPPNSALIKVMERDLPSVKGMIQTDSLHAARNILDWVANRVVWTEDMTIERATYYKVLGQSPAQTFFDMFEKQSGATFCGGLAVFLNKIYHLLGYNSFVLSFGEVEGNLTHVLTVIAQKKGTEWKFYTYDPSFNLTYVGKDGRPLDLFAALTGEAAYADTRSIRSRKWLIPNSTPARCEKKLSEGNDYAVCQVPSYSVDSFMRDVAPAWANLGVEASPQGFLSLIKRRVYSVSYSNNQEAEKAFLQNLQTLGIPLGYE